MLIRNAETKAAKVVAKFSKYVWVHYGMRIVLAAAWLDSDDGLSMAL